MNPNNQQPYHNFHQHTPGPPQPQWQSPAGQPGRAWGDPRLSTASPVAPSPSTQFGAPGYGQGQALPPPPPPPAGGFPYPAQAHTSNASQYDTARWGVKFNQGQQFAPPQDNALRPPLPPRPSSAQADQYPGWNTQSTQQAPPVPPPRPPEYAIPEQQPQQPPQSTYYPHEQYSNRPSSHYYEPSTSQWHPNQIQNHSTMPSWQLPHHMHDAPVSPIEPSLQHGWHAPPSAPQPNDQSYNQAPPPQTQTPFRPHSTSIPAVGASALGTGGPSDWQHYPGDDFYYQEQASQGLQAQLHPQQHGPQDSYASSAVTPEQIHAAPVHDSPHRYPQAQAPSALPQEHAASQQQQQQQQQHYQNQTPIQQSHATSYDGQPTDRPRLGSDASAGSLGPPARAGTIDSVMNAWNASTTSDVKVEALKAAPKLMSPYEAPAVPHREVSSAQTQTDFPPIIKTETKVETKVETREIDPYEDLRNEYRTSLNRYATMLRQEMAAQTEQEKMKIVFGFVNREVKLRAVLFNAEPAELVRSSELAELRKAAERAKAEEIMTIPPMPVVEKQPGPTPKPPQIDTQTPSPQSSKDDGFVVVNANADDAEYSPGGRPRVALPTKTPVQQRPRTPLAQSGQARSQTPAQALVQPPSPGSNAPMTLDDYVMPEHPFRGGPGQGPVRTVGSQRPGDAGPISTDKASNNAAPIPFQPSRPAYTPFKYTGTAATLISSNNPADQAYLKARHEQATESGRLMGQEPPLLNVVAPDRTQSATPSRARQQQEEAFIGLLRQQSKAIRRPETAPPADRPAPLRAGTPLKRRQSLPPLLKSAETLRQSLPTNIAQLGVVKNSHPNIAPLSSSLTAVVDDFGFIHATVVAWDKENRKHRQQLDAERAERESENQSRIDQLFHDNEIGYADIGPLEEDFKIDEASKKWDEDQDELETFTRSVFEKVTERLGKEVADLETLRIKALDTLDLGAQSASTKIRIALSDPSRALEKAPLTDAMALMLQIYDKIEIRQKKIAEAHFERERRRKRLELTVLYTNGDTAGVKKLEKDFDKAQTAQILAEARKRDERANKLMDSFDRAVVRGLAENQEWIDETLNRASLLRDLVLGSETNGPQGRDREELLYGAGGIKETFDILHDAVAMVSQDSKELVQMSTHADQTLNEADFAMFVAEATIADADDGEFEKLRIEKAKEDQKLKDESEGRMNGIQRGPEEIFGCIKDVRDYIGNDKDHQSRINEALERAKQRNQSPTGTPAAGGVGSLKEV